MAAEIHINKYLESLGYDPEKLISHIHNYIHPDKFVTLLIWRNSNER